ncbi:type II toxin-antitoxin system Phd/YefM family antitoxin [Synechocystis sp. PCC 7339]|uniref:type II toxin-antitoxin system Phd/YefM family antitoxin n=1 Tax=unclassified Synechocystis TaxID=2640012 RepID=UPI001BAEB250|nr:MULTISPECIES: type II toxin-antitoxin system Phd/YefM family antitoxin [unclassified Synechocystis]QUS62160.1 type II toxin-antitoxin system Phd/YefM family antitoxin [Synechocystis sp. PCC 7338]UAJ71343.1 type II toxin-antitoxin system Phd/YefM family antitoxin [Synechocystis sp. PCC 7339]
MNTITVNQFTNSLKTFIEQVIKQHSPIKVINQDGEDFVIISAEDWEQQQETLFVLQNNELMKQIAESMTTHQKKQGYLPNQEETNEILGF